MFDHFGDFKRQLPDRDPDETGDWIDSLDSVMETAGRARAQFILYRLLKRARQHNLGPPRRASTRSASTISSVARTPTGWATRSTSRATRRRASMPARSSRVG